MDSRELTSAANALIEWFNHQEISRADAQEVMAKVIAKIIVGKVGPLDRTALLQELDKIHLAITHALNERMVQVARGRTGEGPLVPPKRSPPNA
jgi:hypothetical protein